jgi:anaerobic magnesium-protoporphyrin IX monomethyl ester cyclase
MTPSTDIFLVNPPASDAQRRGPIKQLIRNLFFNSPPLGIAYVAAYLEREGFAVRLLDAGVEGLTIEETAARIIAEGPAILGVTATSNFYGNALNLARRVRAGLPSVFTVLGGPHGTSCADEVMEQGEFDAVVLGEGEITTSELVAAVVSGADLSTVAGIVYRDGGEVVRTPPRPLIKNLDDLPMPARHLLSLDKYIPQPNDGPFVPKQAMISSRGCPYQCTFCDHGTYGVTYRSFSPERIVAEMEELVVRYGAKDIAFVDSLFMVSKDRVRRIIAEMRRRNLTVHWTCTIRANVADRAVLEEMKAAGCWRVRIGIESGSERILDLIRKEVALKDIDAAVRVADELGLHPKAFFIIGHPGETRETILESIKLACRLPLTDITVQLNTPLPGAAQWETAAEHGTFTSPDWTRYTFWEPIYIPEALTAKELDDLYRLFYRRFYYRPIIVRRHLRMIKDWRDLARVFRGVRVLASMTLSILRRDG